MKYKRENLNRQKFNPGKLYMLAGVGWGTLPTFSVDKTTVGYESVGEIEVSGKDYRLLHRFIVDGERDITPDLELLFCSVMNLLTAEDAVIIEEKHEIQNW